MFPPMTYRIVNRYLDHPAWPPLLPVQLDPDRPAIWCKLEFLNPSGSTKDRIANFILTKALRQGRIRPGGAVVEASSGSTSIAMALASAQLGLKFTAVLPEGVSQERLMIIQSYGGEVIFTPKAEGILGAIRGAERYAAESGAFLPEQFANPDNPAAHRLQTAREIVAQVPGGRVDAVVSGVGTGGTLVGLWQGFRDHGCDVLPFAARPVCGTAITEIECCSFSGRIPGVADGLSRIYREADLPGLVEIDVVDDLAIKATRELMRRGFPVGPSSGLNFQAALQAAERLPADSVVVTVFPDRMERYFSTELFRHG